MRRLFLLVVGLVVVLSAAATARYLHWTRVTLERLEGGSQVAETARGPIEYARVGREGPVVLALHGTPGGYDQTLPLGRLAEREGYQLVAVSRPGYLRSPLEVGRTPAEQADAYAALLDALLVQKVAVIGISGGGPSAIEFALRYPERCWALVCLSAVAHAQEPRAPPQGANRILGWLLESEGVRWLLHEALVRRPSTIIPLVLRDPADRKRVLADPAGLAGVINTIGSVLVGFSQRASGVENDRRQFESLPDYPLERLRVPTLVLVGTKDRLLRDARFLAENVPRAELRTFEAGHFLGSTHRAELADALTDFLRRQSPRG